MALFPLPCHNAVSHKGLITMGTCVSLWSYIFPQSLPMGTPGPRPLWPMCNSSCYGNMHFRIHLSQRSQSSSLLLESFLVFVKPKMVLPSTRTSGRTMTPFGGKGKWRYPINIMQTCFVTFRNKDRTEANGCHVNYQWITRHRILDKMQDLCCYAHKMILDFLKLITLVPSVIFSVQWNTALHTAYLSWIVYD